MSLSPPDNQRDITRLELTLDATNKNVEQLLKLVRDGNGSAPLITRVQTLEANLNNFESNLDDFREKLDTIDEKMENFNSRLSEHKQEFSLLRQEFKQFIHTFNEQKQKQERTQLKRAELVWGGLITIAISLFLNYVVAVYGVAKPAEAATKPTTIEIPVH